MRVTAIVCAIQIANRIFFGIAGMTKPTAIQRRANKVRIGCLCCIEVFSASESYFWVIKGVEGTNKHT
jgi:hypothetical protein